MGKGIKNLTAVFFDQEKPEGFTLFQDHRADNAVFEQRHLKFGVDIVLRIECPVEILRGGRKNDTSFRINDRFFQNMAAGIACFQKILRQFVEREIQSRNPVKISLNIPDLHRTGNRKPGGGIFIHIGLPPDGTPAFSAWRYHGRLRGS